MKKYLRGDLFYADLGQGVGSEQSGIRPVLIIQNNVGNRHSPTVIVSPITTQRKKSFLPTHVYLPPVAGLRHKSMVMLEQIRTVDKCRLGDYVGILDDEFMDYIDEALGISVGLEEVHPTEMPRPRSQQGNKSDEMILCLCPVCARQFINSPDHIIKRVDPLQAKKDTCTYCDVGEGYDYRIIHRKKRLGDDRY